MTIRRTALGPLGRRLLAAFVLVALAAVALVATAGLVGSSLGLSRSTAASRSDVTGRVAAAAAAAYAAVGTWSDADLTGAVTSAAAAGARLVVLDADGRPVVSSAAGRHGTGTGDGVGAGNGMGMTGRGTSTITGARAVQVTSPVIVDGARVGTVVVGFAAGSDTTGRRLAWSWVLGAAVAAVAVAVTAGWFVVRSLTRPLVALTAATRAFGTGDVTARPAERGVGELAELAGAFDQAAEAVQRSDRTRRQMTADVAHELRTPLTALQAGLEELRDELVEPDRDTLTRLHDQTLRLARTVQELSDLSAADAAVGDLHPEDLDLAAVTKDALAAREAQLRAAGLRVHADLAPGRVVRVDVDRYHQIVGNLLDNCARHCRPGDQVHVSVGPAAGGVTAPGAAGSARLVVRDSGPGIPAEDLPHVLERFWRGRDRRAVAGTGVGLAVVARLVEAHRGSLAVDSDGATGTTVTIDLPVVRAAAAGPDRAAVSGSR
ncbi:MAG: ATP-binding protein [Kineosporiaceae bacterium]